MLIIKVIKYFVLHLYVQSSKKRQNMSNIFKVNNKDTRINAGWTLETIVLGNKFVLSNCEKYIVQWARKICWATCFHPDSPNIRLDQFSQQLFKKLSRTLLSNIGRQTLRSHTTKSIKHQNQMKAKLKFVPFLKVCFTVKSSPRYITLVTNKFMVMMVMYLHLSGIPTCYYVELMCHHNICLICLSLIFFIKPKINNNKQTAHFSACCYVSLCNNCHTL